MRKVIEIAICAVLLAITGCKRDLNVQDYVRYVNGTENGLIRTVRVEGFEYSLQYKPYDYIVLLENKGPVSEKKMKQRRQELEGTAWFNISIGRTDNVSPLRFNLSSAGDYETRLDYFLNRAKKDIWMIYGNDTIYPVSYLFENNYNLAPKETMVVGFYLPKGEGYPQKEMKLSYNDRIFKNGIIRAEFPEKTLKNIPNLAN